MPYPVIAVANAIIETARKSGKRVSPLKLQKLTYLAQGVALAALGKPLFAERVEAWKYGPVVQSLYDQLKQYGSEEIAQNIERPAVDWFRPAIVSEEDKSGWEVVDAVWKTYGHLDAPALVALTHRENLPEGYPWYHAWVINNGQYRPNTDINEDVMKDSFSRVVKTKQAL